LPEGKTVKNRLHLDLRPADQAAEVIRLEALGARRVSIGQGDVSWVVMADPDGNEFDVLQPLTPDELPAGHDALGRLALTAPAGMDLSTSMPDQPAALRRWHAVVTSKNPALLDDLLADDVVFRSPAVFAPQEGKVLTASYLSAALKVLGPSLRYVSQWHDQASAVLEFEADLGGVYVQGVDILRWNAEGKLVSFTVMVRPLRGLHKLVELMALQLGASQT
jgi:hypothetical protein